MQGSRVLESTVMRSSMPILRRSVLKGSVNHYLMSRSFSSGSRQMSRLSEALRSVSRSPYARLMRLDRPAGTWLLFLPASWSITLASSSFIEAVPFLAMFAAGSVLLRGAGCTINDFWDREIDKRVERTRSRPIAAGEVSPKRAILFFGAQCLAGLPILLSFNTTTICLGVVSLMPVIAYPLAKRIVPWPQAALGLTFNFGALMGWSAVTDSIDPAALLLYTGSFLWTQVYDTLYAHADKEDDQHVGINSSALVLRDRTKPVLTVLAIAQYATLVSGCHMAELGNAELWLAPAHAYLVSLVWRTELNRPEQCISAFSQNVWVGLYILLAIALAKLTLQGREAESRRQHVSPHRLQR
mmetsp:Transcript_7512/g.22793  ORF Transcript_7512/g.22793 Transcript_7512/m.22793 type:complete len:356 (-) Transcript_7512:2211-3278(-)